MPDAATFICLSYVAYSTNYKVNKCGYSCYWQCYPTWSAILIWGLQPRVSGGLESSSNERGQLSHGGGSGDEFFLKLKHYAAIVYRLWMQKRPQFENCAQFTSWFLTCIHYLETTRRFWPAIPCLLPPLLPVQISHRSVVRLVAWYCLFPSVTQPISKFIGWINFVFNAAAGTETNMASTDMPLFNEHTTGGVNHALLFLCIYE